MKGSTILTPSDTRRLRALFVSAFTVMDIAEALASFDGEREAGRVRASMGKAGHAVIGVRAEGATVGFAEADELGDGPLSAYAKPFPPGAVLHRASPLDEVALALDSHPYAFVSVLGQVTLVVSPGDFQKAPARMWLFGMITTIEMNLTHAVRALLPDGLWQRKLSPGRLQKARALQEERARRGRACDLLDCLQISDKAGVLIGDPQTRDRLGYRSARAANRIVKAIEALRNNLAHSQDIVSHDWATILELSRNLDDLLEAKRLSALLP